MHFGGGGTGNALANELGNITNMTCDGEGEFLVGFGVLHVLNIVLSNAGGLEKRTFLQLSHILYDFQEKFSSGEWSKYVEEAKSDFGLEK